jgi:hypothetical protein
MLDFTDIAVFIGMLFLRIGVPALIIVGVGYLLKRLDARWEAEARAYQAKVAAEQPAVQPEAPAEAPAPSPRPGKQPEMPLPFIPPQPPSKEQRVGMYAQPGLSAKPGPATSGKAKCATQSQPGTPCWQLRLKAEGHVPEECVTCDIFQHYPSM